MKRVGEAQWNGGLKDGKGTVSTKRGTLNHTQYSFKTRFEERQGTNTEELIAAAPWVVFQWHLLRNLKKKAIRQTAFKRWPRKHLMWATKVKIMNLNIRITSTIKLRSIMLFMIAAVQVFAAHQDIQPYELDLANKRLNNIYKMIFHDMQPALQMKLKKAQRQWIVFRNLDCAWAFGAKPLDCMIDRTVNRAKELEQTIFFNAKGDYSSDGESLVDTKNNNSKKQITNLPTSLLYNGKPIDAWCFTDSHSDSLEKCGISFEKDIKKVGQNKQLEKKGYTGYEYHFKDFGSTHGYSYYRFISHIGNKDVIFTLSSGGGSGQFTAIKTIDRIGDQLNLRTYDIGDRCNNGISDVKHDKQQITYRAHITPFDFLTLAEDNPHKLQAYDDLAACAACCAGTVLISRPLNDNFSKATIKSVDFSNYSLEDGGYTSKKPYQACFNSMIATYKVRHETVLTLIELKSFVQQFNQQCVH